MIRGTGVITTSAYFQTPKRHDRDSFGNLNDPLDIGMKEYLVGMFW